MFLLSVQFLACCMPDNDSHFMDNVCVQCVCPGLCHPWLQGKVPSPLVRQVPWGLGSLPEPPSPTPGHVRPWVSMKDVVTPRPPSPQSLHQMLWPLGEFSDHIWSGTFSFPALVVIPCSVTCLNGAGRVGMALQQDMVSESCGFLCLLEPPWWQDFISQQQLVWAKRALHVHSCCLDPLKEKGAGCKHCFFSHHSLFWELFSLEAAAPQGKMLSSLGWEFTSAGMQPVRSWCKVELARMLFPCPSPPAGSWSAVRSKPWHRKGGSRALVLSGLGTPCPRQQEPDWALLMVRRDMSVTAERPECSHLPPPGPMVRPNPSRAAHGSCPFPRVRSTPRRSHGYLLWSRPWDSRPAADYRNTYF